MNLHFIILGCKPKGRYTEQHDVFFGIGNSLKDLLPSIAKFWPNSGKIHFDSWRLITNVDGYKIAVVPKEISTKNEQLKLFFLNLGGYKPNDMEEYHYKLFTIATTKAEAIKKAMNTAFYKHTGFSTKASSHIDDRYGVDVDDIYEIEEILSTEYKQKYTITIEKIGETLPEDELHIGYTKWSSLL